MTATMLEQAAMLRAGLAAFDPALLSGDDAAEAAEALALTEKACAVARARAGARAAECRSHQRRGFADAAEWPARVSGATRSDAKAALTAGELSWEQAAVISAPGPTAPAAKASWWPWPGSRRWPSSKTKGGGGAWRRPIPTRCTAATTGPGSSATGATPRAWSAALPPPVGVALMNRLDGECDRIRRAATDPEPRAAHGADALVAMLEGTGCARRASTDLVLVCDLAAYRRAHARTAARGHPTDPDRRDYGSCAAFSHPDANGWLLREVKTRAPGR